MQYTVAKFTMMSNGKREYRDIKVNGRWGFSVDTDAEAIEIAKSIATTAGTYNISSATGSLRPIDGLRNMKPFHRFTV